MTAIQRTCDVETLPDFARYYQQAWVGWHPTDAEHITPCYVYGMLDGTHVQLRMLTNQGDGKFLMEKGFPVSWEELKSHVDFGVPDIGMMPDGPTIVFTSYNTPRIARKGYRCRDTRISEFNSWDIRRKYIARSSGERYDWTWFAFNPEYRSLEQAEERLAGGESVGILLSRTLGVYTAPKFKHSLLAYKRWTVGHVVTPYLIQLKQEYADYEEDIARQTGAEVIVR